MRTLSSRMSLGRNEIRDISISPDCLNLTTLLLTRSGTLVNISGKFFQSMPKLVILDLSTNINLAKLPEEVSNLVSLRHLDLSRTCLENLPEGLGKLIQLRYFALRGVRTRPSLSVISSLLNIEMLLFDTTFVNMELIDVIKLMENLKGLGISIKSTVVLKHLLSIPRLASCIQHITLERVISKDGPLQLETAMASLRSIEIQGGTISDIMEHTRYGCISTCFQNLSVVKISRVNGMQDLSWLVFAPNLISIHVMGPSRELQEIISREKVSGILNERSSIVPFRKLREIQLRFLMELKSIYWERLEFPSLKRVTIFYSPSSGTLRAPRLSPNILRGASSKKRKLSQIQHSPSNGKKRMAGESSKGPLISGATIQVPRAGIEAPLIPKNPAIQLIPAMNRKQKGKRASTPQQTSTSQQGNVKHKESH
ncbi:hypothetical protein F2Q69_00060536 [Brassica cretica]|uniref:Disease resistance R13L4/SHOC-2-like LRR domain-containing protein n=1 Tax=Brassica cretica TaxID=69181 RepID=A0A8S9RK77_BRACR|nr:hypothetical protein F2Q69_00060536 [Brassica cretica]